MRAHQGQQAGVEEDVALRDVHATEELTEVGAVVQRHVGRRQQHVALQHAVQVHRQQLHALWQDQLEGGREGEGERVFEFLQMLILAISFYLGYIGYTLGNGNGNEIN